MNILQDLSTHVIAQLRLGMKAALRSHWTIDGYAPQISVIEDDPDHARVAIMFHLRRKDNDPFGETPDWLKRK
jgi:hypothetical protein